MQYAFSVGVNSSSSSDLPPFSPLQKRKNEYQTTLALLVVQLSQS